MKGRRGFLDVLRSLWSRGLLAPSYWKYWWRLVKFKLKNPHIITLGPVFLGKTAEVYCRKGYGRMVIGRWVHIGEGNAIRCHEGNLRIGDKVVFGANNTVNVYLDLEIGDETIIADWVYICDFDHRYADPDVPIRKQGIVKSPVRIGRDVWIGEKCTILRGVDVGDGSVIGAHTVVNRDVPPYSVAVGNPAKVVKRRGGAAPNRPVASGP